MTIISEASQAVLKILKPVKTAGECTRLLHYCISQSMDNSVLLYNLLTREMVLLSEKEWEARFQNDYLKAHWFVVPEETSDKEYADLVRWVLETRQKKPKNITGYTIFTTTDCNARCFYCFELGRSRIPMTEETAHKVAAYIADHCGGERVSISWFGGEPLFNSKVIDIICQDLKDQNIAYSSSMVSNGYLFSKETVEQAVAHWNLKRVQITLDGTEAVYNKAKAYIYRQGSPYQVVMQNITHLLDASIRVSIRLNMDMHNAENLLQLVEELADRYAGKPGLTVYAHHIFKAEEPMATLHTAQGWQIREEAMARLNQRIRELGLAARPGIVKNLKTNYCMADSGRSVTILPGGEIGLCEHFSENEFIGHIDREGFDQAVVNSWKERLPEIPECAECFCYPQCRQLKKCASGSICFELQRREKLEKEIQRIRNEYARWKQQEQEEEQEESLC